MQAFPVDDKHPDYSTGAPTSAADYLRRVHKEAAESADVTSIAPTEIPGYGSSVANDERPRDYFKADIAPAPEWYTENEEWTMQLTEWFTNLRKQIADGKSKSDVNVDIPHANDEDGWKRLLLAGNSKGWLTEAASNDPNGGVADMLLDGHRPHWMFALLLCLEKPLLRDVAATLRSILKHLAAARASIESDKDEKFAPLTVFITLLSRFYGQG